MRPSSSSSEGGLFAAVLGRGGPAGQVDDQAWLAAMLQMETALAGAAARLGAVSDSAAAAVALACSDPGRFDLAELGRQAAATGNPVPPLVERIRALVPPQAGVAVHFGATSQDVLDTAMVLVSKRALLLLSEDLAAVAGAAAALALTHRDTVMAGRTLLQQAVPITFGLKAAGWTTMLDGAWVRVGATARSLPVQYGGAAGTLAAAEGHGLALLGELAARLGLAEPVLPWHTARLPVADLAAALGATCGVVAKIATDVVLLSQTEVGEVSEGVPARGGSSTMAHKRNPVAAVSARAAARRAPGLVAGLLSSMEAEHERAAGPWHAEWETLSELVRAAGSSVAWLRDCLENLRVDPERMTANLSEDLRGVRAGDAQALVDRALDSHRSHHPDAS